jgi:hypothetical protein
MIMKRPLFKFQEEIVQEIIKSKKIRHHIQVGFGTFSILLRIAELSAPSLVFIQCHVAEAIAFEKIIRKERIKNVRLIVH